MVVGRLIVLAVLLLGVSASAQPPQRIVSLVPAVTEMLFAMDAGPNVVGVSQFDRYPPEATTRPNVGGLLDPDIERILSLHPTLVVFYDTQVDLRNELARAGISAFAYRHGSIADVFDTIERLGASVNRVQQSHALTRRMQTEIADVRAHVRGFPRVPTLFVIGRDPGELRHVYVAGGEAFLNELIDLAGGINVCRDIARPAAEVSTEQILVRQPEVIVESWANRPMDRQSREAEIAVWNRLASLPAVRRHRVVEITDNRLAVPGPRLPQGIRILAETLHPDAFRTGANKPD